MTSHWQLGTIEASGRQEIMAADGPWQVSGAKTCAEHETRNQVPRKPGTNWEVDFGSIKVRRGVHTGWKTGSRKLWSEGSCQPGWAL